jgi:hypothetical protein
MTTTSQQVTFEKNDFNEITPEIIEQVSTLVIYLAHELELNYSVEVIQAHVEGLIETRHGELYTAWADGKMVGMMGLVYNPELWNSSDITATEISWYVLPAYRGLTGMRFIKYVENNLNCGKIRLGVGNILLRKMLERQGYKCTKYIMEKDISHGSADSSGSSRAGC